MRQKTFYNNIIILYTPQAVLPVCRSHKHRWDHCHRSTLSRRLCGLGPPRSFQGTVQKHVRIQHFNYRVYAGKFKLNLKPIMTFLRPFPNTLRPHRHFDF